MAEIILFENLRFRPSIRKGGNYVKDVQTKKNIPFKKYPDMCGRGVTPYTRHSCLVSTRSSVSRQTAGLILKS